jgi:23S rRNA (guanosine2251-2'-O)-methyltransferase
MSQLEKIYGVHAVEALLRHHPKRVKQIWLAEGRNDPRVQTLIELANENRVQVGQAERREMRRCSTSCWIALKARRCCWCWTA